MATTIGRRALFATNSTLMGLWSFIIANGVTCRDETAVVRKFVEEITLERLQNPDTWKTLTTLVRIRPRSDIVPVRAKYSDVSSTIGLNYLTSDEPLWFTLADVIASKILTGKCPEIIEAMRFIPDESQTDLKQTLIGGNSKYRIDPATDDFFKRIIDRRAEIKNEMKSAKSAEREALDSEQQALKILANSTSYGIFIEFIVQHLDKRETQDCFCASGESFKIDTDKVEEPGRYFHPLLAILITGAARLMLATAEQLTLNAGLNWAFCDTDSIAIAKSENIDDAEFYFRATSIRKWFESLNPYEIKGSILKTEDVNYRLDGNSISKEFEPLFAYCVSAKRYALYNLTPDGEIVIRKASAHGLGHLLVPYNDDNAPASISAPVAPLAEIGVNRWQYDLWYQIIRAASDGHPDQMALDYHPNLAKAAASRYGATTTDLLSWFKARNEGRSYADQVKPFNFMLAFRGRPSLELSPDEELATPRRGRPRKAEPIRPVAPFDKSPATAARNAFDRTTGKPVSIADLMTYREALAQYHLSPESKFRNADFTDRGRTKRRHVFATGVVVIGKEANKLEEQFFLGRDEDAEIEYGAEPRGEAPRLRLETLCTEVGERQTAIRLGISRTALRRVRDGKPPTRKIKAKLLL